MIIRKEAETDHPLVYQLNARVFESDGEAKLVEKLRGSPDTLLSLVAEKKERIVGHIMFSKVSLIGHADLKLVGLAPLAVAPETQNMGIGGELVNRGLSQCRELGVDAIVVIGHSHYFPKFGFKPGASFGVDCEYDVPEDVFMLSELKEGALTGKKGVVFYHPAFATL